MSEGRSELSQVKHILGQTKNQVKLECREQVFEGNKKLTSDDLKTPQNPEEFTKRYIIEKVFSLLGVSYEGGERHFRTTDGIRKVDYEADSRELKFLVEAKAINDDLHRARYGAVEQVKGLFRLAEVKEKYSFGIATDGLRWIFINPLKEEVGSFSLLTDFSKIREFISGRRDVRKEKKQAEISKRFYQWYNALLHGGTFRDLKGRQRSIPVDGCLVKNIHNVETYEEKEGIAQVIVDRLIFIKFLQSKGLIKEDILEYLSKQDEDILNAKLKQLFFAVLNTKEDDRVSVDRNFLSIPYLNGSLFNRTPTENKNPDYFVTAEILRALIDFLETFRFVHDEVNEREETLDPEILGYLFERAMNALDRKGTGAYYTPKYITQYICENTIHPLILEKVNDFLANEKGFMETELLKDIDGISSTLSDTTLVEVFELLKSVRVLDPACGSGAFLLSAAQTIYTLNKKIKNRLGERFISDVGIKRSILKNNIFGVDINSNAIEIAKLRLWLWLVDSYTSTDVEPLPNIDYNLRSGNTLVGYIDISKFKEFKLSLLDYMDEEASLNKLLKERDKYIKEYKDAVGSRAKELKKQIDDLDAKIKKQLDYSLYVEFKSKGIKLPREEFNNLKPFHWGLEFHDAFENGAGGFDIVIGNPPYVRQEALGDFKKILKKYYEVYHGVADLYTYFFERGHKVLRQGGRFGFISSNKFIKANYGKSLRAFLKNKNRIKELIDFGDLPVFEDAAIMPAIIITERQKAEKQEFKFAQMETLQFDSLQYEVKRKVSVLDDAALEGDNWSLASGEEIKIITKMRQNGVPLKTYIDGKINYGIKTGFNKAFIIDSKTRDQLIKEDEKSAEIIKPFVVGDDVRKYEINIQDRSLIFTRRGVNIDEYPAIKRHLEQFKEELMPKPPDWDDERDGKWNGRKPGPYEWYEIQDTVAYYEDFEKPKIIYPVIAKEQRFAFDTEGYYSNDKTFIIPVNDLFLLSILNSKLTFKFAQSTFSGLLGKEFEFRAVHLSSLSIRRISFSTPKDEREKLVTELKEYYAHGEFDRILSAVEACLPKDEEGNFIAEEEKSDVVHDLLAFLAEQMIEMNKEKNAEIKRFIAWLEGYTKLKVDEMVLKSKVKEYHKYDWDEMYRVLARNKAKIKFDVTKEKPQNKIKAEFEASIAKLKPLLRRIEETDRLIDQVVYKLYGLTEEEIKTVVGAS